MSDTPRILDKVYSYRRAESGKGQPNGKIIAIVSYHDPREYLIEFFDKPRVTTDTFDEAELTWMTEYGGIWGIL